MKRKNRKENRDDKILSKETEKSEWKTIRELENHKNSRVVEH